MWGVLIVVVSVALLNSDGLAAVQSMTLVVALPFAVVMILMCVSLWRALTVDKRYYNTQLTPGSTYWTGEHWQKHLNQVLKQSQREDASHFMNSVALPAMNILCKELSGKHDLNAFVTELHDKMRSVELSVVHDSVRSFVYGVRIQKRQASSSLIEDETVPNMQHEETYEPVCYFGDGRKGYDIQYMGKEELIIDIVRQYERYLMLLDDEQHNLMTQAPIEDELPR